MDALILLIIVVLALTIGYLYLKNAIMTNHLYLIQMPKNYTMVISTPSVADAVLIRRREMEEAMHAREVIAEATLSRRAARRVSKQVDERHARTFLLRAEHLDTCPCTYVSSLTADDLY